MGDVKTVTRFCEAVNRACDDILQLEATSVALFEQKLTRADDCEADWTVLMMHQIRVVDAIQHFFQITCSPLAPAWFCTLSKQRTMVHLLWSNIVRLLTPLAARMPHTSEHCVAFFVSAYSTIAWLSESTAGLQKIWFTILGRLAAWKPVSLSLDRAGHQVLAQTWFLQAQDLAPTSGTLQYHLACLPCRSTKKLAFLCGALLCAQREDRAREQIKDLLHRVKSGTAGPCHHAVSVFMRSIAELYFHGDPHYYDYLAARLDTKLEAYVKDKVTDFRVQGSEIALIVSAALVGFGTESRDAGWVIEGAFHMLSLIIKRLSHLVQNHDVFPLMHIMLARLCVLSNDSASPKYLRDCGLWEGLAAFLNRLSDTNSFDSIDNGSVNIHQRLPEDFLIRPLAWSRQYFPSTHFDGELEGQEERSLELPGHTAVRVARIRTLGHQLALHQPRLGLRYDDFDRTFRVAGWEEHVRSGDETSAPQNLAG